MAVTRWAKVNHPQRIIIPTDIFHTRRVRWLFRKALKKSHVTVLMEPVAPRDYTAANWWQHEQGLIAFQNEIVKYAYYRWKY